MTDLWLNIIWTMLIATATVISDWIAGSFINMTRGFSAIRRAIDQAVADKEKVADVKREVEALSKRAASSLTWGADLVTVAIGLDLATLGIWTNNKEYFPFFQKWNTESLNREIQIWLVVILIHLVLLLLSIIFKHLHGDKIESLNSTDLAKTLSWKWVPQNRWMLTGNVIGFITLFSSFMIITDSI